MYKPFSHSCIPCVLGWPEVVSISPKAIWITANQVTDLNQWRQSYEDVKFYYPSRYSRLYVYIPGVSSWFSVDWNPVKLAHIKLKCSDKQLHYRRSEACTCLALYCLVLPNSTHNNWAALVFLVERDRSFYILLGGKPKRCIWTFW